jgi:hypothetical protein
MGAKISTRRNAFFFRGEKFENASDNYCNDQWVASLTKKNRTNNLKQARRGQRKRLEMNAVRVYVFWCYRYKIGVAFFHKNGSKYFFMVRLVFSNLF